MVRTPLHAHQKPPQPLTQPFVGPQIGASSSNCSVKSPLTFLSQMAIWLKYVTKSEKLIQNTPSFLSLTYASSLAIFGFWVHSLLPSDHAPFHSNVAQGLRTLTNFCPPMPNLPPAVRTE